MLALLQRPSREAQSVSEYDSGREAHLIGTNQDTTVGHYVSDTVRSAAVIEGGLPLLDRESPNDGYLQFHKAQSARQYRHLIRAG